MNIFGIEIGKKESKDLINENKKLKSELTALKKDYNSLPYNFDYLSELYTPNQANALVYKLINHHRNSFPANVELLTRWHKRIVDAINSIK